MNEAEKAKELFEKGCNCPQAVFLAFNDLMKLDEKTALRIVAGFGGGFGRMREVCGAVSGMVAVISFFKAGEDPNDREKKIALYTSVQRAMNEFKSKNGSYICREILGLNGNSKPVPEPRTPDFYKKRPCGDLCASAAEIAAREIFGEQGI